MTEVYYKEHEVLQSDIDCFYKVCQVLQRVTDFYKVIQVLQSVIVITKRDVTSVRTKKCSKQ